MSEKGKHGYSAFSKYGKESYQEKKAHCPSGCETIQIKNKNYTNFLLGVMLYVIVACIQGKKSNLFEIL